MPTNPDYIEHTEKAAWDTVQALREQVVRERQKSERLTRLEPSLPRLAELLDEIAGELGMGVAPPVHIVEQLRERLRQVTAERDELRAARAPAPAAPPPSAPEQPARRSQSGSSAVRWFARQLERRRQERAIDADLEPSGETLAEVATHVEEQLQHATPLPYAPAAILERALDVGLWAMDLARAARRAQRSR